MRLIPILAAVMMISVTGAMAKVPLLNATCPRGLEVHADAGGPVYINGKEARLKVFNANYYEATYKGVTISISINPDGSPSVSYTARGGGNGICTVADDSAPPPEPKPTPVTPAAVDPEMLRRYCQGEAAAKFNVRPADLTTHMGFKSGRQYVVQGYFDSNGDTTFFNCWFDLNGRFKYIG